ncbi:MAG: flagellar motor switch phosphatase FliY [Clostridiales bacterium]|jgi:flagellar motor switch protein FliN/FliY|nr:flagellar motor switch phosphatase FliY [Clostridiales bacterium]
MGDMLSQAEIEALLNGTGSEDAPGGGGGAPEAEGGEAGAGAAAAAEAGGAAAAQADGDDSDFYFGDSPDSEFTAEEVDALGEIGNISMGNSATTLFTLLNRKVNITTPKVTISTLRRIGANYRAPLVVVRVEYTEGLLGSNMLMLKESDVMVITDLMMGGDGRDANGEITELHLSAISEAMNQMIGNSSTSLSNVFDTKIDISPPTAISVKVNDPETLLEAINIDPDEKVAVVSFNMTVEGLLDTKIMQIQPLTFAKEIIDRLMASGRAAASAAQAQAAAQEQAAANVQAAAMQQAPPPYPPQYGAPPQQYPPQPQYGPQQQYPAPPQYVNVQPAKFQAFEDEQMVFDKKNIGLVMDVQLEVSVELGRTHKLIKEILEFGQGSIIELDKLAGEPVDVLVNGKAIAKGEVVVIDESFGVRVTDIVHPNKRL